MRASRALSVFQVRSPRGPLFVYLGSFENILGQKPKLIGSKKSVEKKNMFFWNRHFLQMSVSKHVGNTSSIKIPALETRLEKVGFLEEKCPQINFNAALPGTIFWHLGGILGDLKPLWCHLGPSWSPLVRILAIFGFSCCSKKSSGKKPVIRNRNFLQISVSKHLGNTNSIKITVLKTRLEKAGFLEEKWLKMASKRSQRSTSRWFPIVPEQCPQEIW